MIWLQSTVCSSPTCGLGYRDPCLVGLATPKGRSGPYCTNPDFAVVEAMASRHRLGRHAPYRPLVCVNVARVRYAPFRQRDIQWGCSGADAPDALVVEALNLKAARQSAFRSGGCVSPLGYHLKTSGRRECCVPRYAPLTYALYSCRSCRVACRLSSCALTNAWSAL